MTIDELIDQAQKHAYEAIYENDAESAMRYAATAQACALTAQAMILAQAMPADTSGRFRVLSIDTGN